MILSVYQNKYTYKSVLKSDEIVIYSLCRINNRILFKIIIKLKLDKNNLFNIKIVYL